MMINDFSSFKFQVSVSAPYPTPNQLLTLHAILWLHVWYYGQIFKCIIWKITYKGWKIAWCSASHPFHNARLYLSSKARFCIFGLQAIHLQMVLETNVASSILYMMLIWICSCIFVLERNYFNKLKLQTWVIPKYKIQVRIIFSY